MDEALYDEFGNYIGPELSDSEAESEEEQDAGSEEEQRSDEDMEVNGTIPPCPLPPSHPTPRKPASVASGVARGSSNFAGCPWCTRTGSSRRPRRLRIGA